LVEIGPGAGAITRALIAAGHRVVAVEVDSRLAPGVADLGPSVRVVVGSILDFRPRDLSAPPVRIVGALPYHLSGAILRWLADWADEVAFAALILQDEVVERMGAPAGHPSRGLLSVILQSVYQVKPLFRISPGAFVPAPKVWSRAVALSRRAGADPVDALTPVWDLARAVFQHRRKMIRTGIARAYGEDACRRAEMSHVDLTLRAERLSLTDLETLATALTRGA
jgi:16S rRNA (adenine1518-N6/adenine1519-N6)-dimethyltransferase